MIPRVTVVIPCYNLSRYLGEAVDSVLAQTWPDVEIIVVDDGSTDDTPAVAARYSQVRYIRQENSGLAAARNAGAKAATGDYLIFLDADDHITPTAIEAGMNCFRENPDAALVYGAGIGFDEDGTYHKPLPPILPGENPYEHLLRTNYIWMPHMSIYSRRIFNEVGGYDMGFDAAADYALNLKLARSYPIVSHPTIVAEWRYRAGSMSRNLPVMLDSLLRVMDAQRPYVAGDPLLRRARRIGIRNWKRNFSVALAKSVAAQARSGERDKNFRRDLFALMRFGPAASARIVSSNVRNRLKHQRALKSGFYLAMSLGQMTRDYWRDPAVFDRLFKTNPDPWRSTSEAEAERVRVTMEMLDKTHPARFKKAFELGCAEGIFTAMVAPRCDEIVAVDYSKVALEHARRRLGSESNVALAQLDIRTDKVPGTFDLVLAMGVLTYLFRPWDLRRACNKLVDALESNGVLLFSDTRQSPVFESASWNTVALRGGEQIRRLLSSDPRLATELTEETETHVFALFRRR